MLSRPIRCLDVFIGIVVVVVVIIVGIQPVVWLKDVCTLRRWRVGWRTVRRRRAGAFRQQRGILRAFHEARRRRRYRPTYLTSALAKPAVDAAVAPEQLDKVGDKLARHFLPLVEQLVTLAGYSLLHRIHLLLHCTHLYDIHYTPVHTYPPAPSLHPPTTHLYTLIHMLLHCTHLYNDIHYTPVRRYTNTPVHTDQYILVL